MSSVVNNTMLMKIFFTNKKALTLTVFAFIAPFLANFSLAQGGPPDPPPPPEVASIAGIAAAILILASVGYGAYTIYKKNSKKVKVA